MVLCCKNEMPYRQSQICMFKGQCHEIFDPLFFSLNCTPGCPDSWAKAVLNIDSNSRRNFIRFDYKIYCHEAGKITYG
jgi:hypothetical protein